MYGYIHLFADEDKAAESACSKLSKPEQHSVRTTSNPREAIVRRKATLRSFAPSPGGEGGKGGG